MTTSTLSASVYTDNQYAIKTHHHSIQSNGNLITAGKSATKFVTDKLMLNSGTMHNPHTKINMLTQMTGQKVGNYTVQERLGGSAYSAVYSARNNLRDQVVALKVLMPDADQITRRRFRQEALTTLDLNHPNIVHTYEADQVDESGLFYISMEHIDGFSLSDFMEEQRHLCLADAANLLEPIARALAYAHSKGIVHRDVKPSNILLKRVAEGTPYSVQLSSLDYPVVPLLSDFGIARVLDLPELTNTGRTIGTPAYMAPEQCAGNRQIDGRADIYSLGTVLYRCLVGNPPFVGTTTQILYAHVYEPLTIPDEMIDKLPGRAVRMLKRMLMKDPEHRYRHVGQLADDLAVMAGRLGAKRNLKSPVNKSAETETMSTVSSVGLKGQTAVSVLVPAPQPRTIVNSGASTFAMMPKPNQSNLLQQKPQQNKPVVKHQMPRQTNRRWYSGSATGVAAAAIVLLFLFGYYGSTSFNLFDFGTMVPITDRAPASSIETLTGTLPSQTDAFADFETAFSLARQKYAERDMVEAQKILAIARDLNLANDDVERAELDQLSNATDNYLNAKDSTAQAVAIDKIFAIYLDHSDELFADRDYCGAYAVIESTLKLAPPSEHHRYQGRVSDYGSRCEGIDQESPLIVNSDDSPNTSGTIEAAEVSVPVVDSGVTGGVVMNPSIPEQGLLDGLSGRILYTTQSQGIRSAMAVGLGKKVSGIKTDNPVAASLQSIVLDQHILRFSQFIQDDTMQHVSWSPTTNQIVYTAQTSTQPQIYLAEVQNLQQSVVLAIGQEPSWNQRGDLVAYSGWAEDGGIWQIYLNTRQSSQLTENSGDRYPVWTPDGESIIFVSNGRDGNWELYTYNRFGAAGQQITRLTNHPAQDSLPAVSPDGKHVAFLSDRGGKWQVWVMSLAAEKLGNNEAEVLFDVAGQMTDWSQGMIQWVP